MRRSAPALPPPPTDKNSTILMAAAALVGALSLAAGWFAFVGAPIAVLFAWLAWRQRIAGRAALRTHAALQALTRGHLEEAEAHLDAVPRNAGTINRTVMRAVPYLRGLVAFHRGDIAAVPDTVAAAVTPKTGFFLENHEKMQRAMALSLRALAYASLGDAERARADAGEVLASPQASPESIARARLAEAVLLARTSATHDALAAHLRAHAALIMEHVQPRERVLARALRRMVQTRSRSVYREPAPRAEEAERNALRDWVAQVVPDAAAHATEGLVLAERAEHAPPPAATNEAMAAVARARAVARTTTKAPRFGLRVLALWAALVIMFLAIWQLLTPATSAHHGRAVPPPDDAVHFGELLPLLVLAVFVALIAKNVRKSRQIERDVLAAQRAIALNEMARAESLLALLEARALGLGLAQAALLRAKKAERDARFEECLAQCDRALGSIAAQQRAVRIVASLTLTPTLIVYRAIALAALGREAEANAELATIARDHPTYGQRPAGELRVRLIAAVRRGDLDAARRHRARADAGDAHSAARRGPRGSRPRDGAARSIPRGTGARRRRAT